METKKSKHEAHDLAQIYLHFISSNFKVFISDGDQEPQTLEFRFLE